VKER
jgi:hypothetical protein